MEAQEGGYILQHTSVLSDTTVLQWRQQLNGATDIEARRHAYLTGLESALRHGIKHLTVYSDPARLPGLFDSTDDAIPFDSARNILAPHFQQLHHTTQMDNDQNHSMTLGKRLAEELAQRAMNAPGYSIGLQYAALDDDSWQQLPPVSEWLTFEQIHGVETDAFDDEVNETNDSVRELDEQLESLQVDSESSAMSDDYGLSSTNTVNSDGLPPPIDEDELASINATCNKWIEAIANGGTTMRAVPRECIDDYTNHAKRFLRTYFDSSLSHLQRCEAFCQFLALPKQVLQKHRGGRSASHQTTRTRNVRQRISEINSMLTEHEEIEPSIMRTRSKAKTTDERDKAVAATIIRAGRLIDSAHVGRAARALTHANGLGNLAEESVLQEMESKHPHHDITSQAINAMNTAEYADLNIDEATVVRTVSRMNNGAAPGYDGLTAAIVKATLRDPESRALHTKLINELVNGRMIAPLASMLQRGRLIAINKTLETIDDDGKVIKATHRPIMIGTFLYRLSAKIVNSLVQPIAATKLSPYQLGISTPGAIEATVHNIREHLRNEPSDAALKLDIENAFNSVSRSKMITEVMTQQWLKPIRAFVRMAYAQPTPIIIPDMSGKCLTENDMYSTQGVRQGDPLGSLLFAISIHPILMQCANEHPSLKLTAYHDDTTIIGDPRTLASAMESLSVSLGSLELNVQPAKSRLIDFNFDDRDESTKSWFNEQGIVVDRECGSVLGCPIGNNDTQENAFMQQKLQSTEQSINILSDPRLSLHHTALILRVSTVHKLDHWMRNVDPSIMQNISKRFDKMLFDIYRRKLNLDQQIDENDHSNPNSNSAMRDLIAAPISLGGDGLTRTETTVDTCFIGGVAAAAAVHHYQRPYTIRR